RLRAVAAEGAFGVILGQVAGDAEQPSPGVEDGFAVLPTFPEPQERLLGDVQSQVGVHPPRVRQRPPLAAVAFVERLELRGAPGGRGMARVHDTRMTNGPGEDNTDQVPKERFLTPRP